MNGEELEARCIKLFGLRHWNKILAEKCDVDFTTVWRWRRNNRPVPRYVNVLLEATEAKQKLDRITASLAKQLK